MVIVVNKLNLTYLLVVLYALNRIERMKKKKTKIKLEIETKITKKKSKTKNINNGWQSAQKT